MINNADEHDESKQREKLEVMLLAFFRHFNIFKKARLGIHDI